MKPLANTELLSKSEVFIEIALIISDLLTEKNKGYDDTFTKLGIEGLKDRIDEKSLRIEGFLNGTLDPKEEKEGMDNAILDIGGYAILAYITHYRGLFPQFDWKMSERKQREQRILRELRKRFANATNKELDQIEFDVFEDEILGS